MSHINFCQYYSRFNLSTMDNVLGIVDVLSGALYRNFLSIDFENRPNKQNNNITTSSLIFVTLHNFSLHFDVFRS